MNSPEISESAKAIQEVAKTTRTAIKTAEKMSQFLSRVMKEWSSPDFMDTISR